MEWLTPFVEWLTPFVRACNGWLHSQLLLWFFIPAPFATLLAGLLESLALLQVCLADRCFYLSDLIFLHFIQQMVLTIFTCGIWFTRPQGGNWFWANHKSLLRLFTATRAAALVMLQCLLPNSDQHSSATDRHPDAKGLPWDHLPAQNRNMQQQHMAPKSR